MKKIKCVIILTVFFISCSFDNSSRIWTGNQEALQSSQKDNLKLVFKTNKVGIFQMRLKKYSMKQKILIGMKIQNILSIFRIVKQDALFLIHNIYRL